MSSKLQSIEYSQGKLRVVDQLKLPHAHAHIDVNSVNDAWTVIRNMNVRGAPAIAIVASLALAVELTNEKKANKGDKSQLVKDLEDKLEYLLTSRPTAVNLKRSCDDIKAILNAQTADSSATSDTVSSSVISYAEKLFADDVRVNVDMGRHGADHILANRADQTSDKVLILTHCNTGSLATAGYGTALGVIRNLHEREALEKAFCTETRPYNQGSRLTAFELVYENIPACLICDSMVGALMRQKRLTAVVVGADRVVRNGDTANKIGTYQLAVLAKHHAVPFYVACPTSTVDLDTMDGDGIRIEERPGSEMASCGCERKQRVPPNDVPIWNPAFDVTPADLITGGIVTEFGVLSPPLDTEENLAAMKMKL